MTQEDKELLITDLCARLPYGVKVKLGDNPNIFDLEYRIKFAVMYGDSDKLEDILDVTNIKPYLFPLSSMTEEQIEELKAVIDEEIEIVIKQLKTDDCGIDNGKYHFNSLLQLNWLNAHHFDYRGLIPKGLANDATGLGIYENR